MDYVLDPEDLRIFFEKCFLKLNISEEIFDPVIKGLIETSLRGVDSHGVRLFPHYVRCLISGRLNKEPKFVFKKTSSGTGILDADNTLGITASTFAMKKAIELAKENGIGAVGVINSSHFGAAALYSLKAAEEDMIGISVTHTESLVVPYGGKRPFLGTNAFCFAAPIEGEEPYCLDMATSTVSLNKIRKYRDEKKEFERGWVVDKNGEICTDFNQESYLTHFGDYKGYGISMMVEILCSILTGMNFAPHITPMFSDLDKKRNLGHFFIAIDIAKFQDVQIFKKRLKELVVSLRTEPTKNNVGTVKVANDPEKENFKKRIKTGIPISDVEFNNFIEIAELLKVDKSIIDSYKKS